MDFTGNDPLWFPLILLGGVGLWFFATSRGGVLQNLQAMAAWVLIFFFIAAAVGIWGELDNRGLTRQVSVEDSGQIVTSQRRDGHYHLTLLVNGVATDFLVDTGATDIVLTRQDARAAGIQLNDLDFVGRALTANGEVRTAPVWLDEVQLGPVTDHRVYAVVNDGSMKRSLLGMGYLQRWGKIEITGGELILTR